MSQHQGPPELCLDCRRDRARAGRSTAVPGVDFANRAEALQSVAWPAWLYPEANVQEFTVTSDYANRGEGLAGMKYRKKPVVVEAIRWDGTRGRADEIFEWSQRSIDWNTGEIMVIKTLEGNIRAQVGDWIVRGVQGELYPIKPEIFKATYSPELAEADPDVADTAWAIIAHHHKHRTAG